MLALRELQQRFAQKILAPDASLSPREQIYRNNVFIGLTGALADVYPVLRRLVGEAFFAQLARRYIRSHPSRSANLHDYGREIPAFLDGIEDLKQHAYLPDIAALEWAWHEAFHAGDAAPLVVHRLGMDSTVQLHPAVRLLESRFPILAIWEANQQADPEPVDLGAGGCRLAVFREGLQPAILRCRAGEFALLGAFAAHTTLAEACAAAVAAEPGLDLAAAMCRFVTHGLLAQEPSHEIPA